MRSKTCGAFISSDTSAHSPHAPRPPPKGLLQVCLQPSKRRDCCKYACNPPTRAAQTRARRTRGYGTAQTSTLTTEANAWHICTGYSPEIAVRFSPRRGPLMICPCAQACRTRHSHFREATGPKSAFERNPCIFFQGAPMTGSHMP